MRQVIIAAWVWSAAAVANAQPAEPTSRPAACAVDIVRAPDDVRGVVEGWVGSELRCSVALEVRIVRTDGGLYLLARDDRGREYERIVPDAESAGVLIASWAADGSVARAAPTSAPPRPVRVAVAEDPIAPPSDARIEAVAPARTRSARRLTVTGSRVLNDTSISPLGMRAQLDVWARRGVVLGVALSLEGASGPIADAYGYRMFGGQAIAYVGRRFQLGAWSITPAVGVGAAAVYFEESSPFGVSSDQSLGSVGQATILISYALTHRLELTAGPLGRWYPHAWHDPQPVDLSLLAGLGWSL